VRIISLVIVLLLCFACGQRRQYPITDTAVDAGYYEDALQSINEQINTSPSNLKLRYKRLFINSHLDWIEEASGDIQRIIKEEGLSRDVYSYGIDYYEKAEDYQSLLNLVNQWKQLTGLIDYKHEIIALDGLEDEKSAKSLLWDYLNDQKTNEDVLHFASNLYQNWRDTTLAIYTMSMLYNQNNSHHYLLNNYVPILVSLGAYERAIEVVNNAEIDSSDVSQRIDIAKVYYGLGVKSKAHQLLQSLENQEVLFVRSEWYQESNQLDSAISMIDLLLKTDTTQQALLRKARLNWDKGLLFGARSLYQEVLKRDSLNSIAQESVTILNRKIAYLRKLREKETSIPFLEISTKKETENE